MAYDDGGPVPVDEAAQQELARADAWLREFDQHFPAAWLDRQEAMRRYHADPVKLLRQTRGAGDKEAAKRGLMFAGERRESDQIVRRYRRPSLWGRLRYCVLRPRLEKPQKESW